MSITKTHFVIKDSKLIEGVDSFYSFDTNSYTSHISKATLFDSHAIAIENTVSDDEEIIEVEVSYKIKDEITKIESHYDEKLEEACR